MDRLLQKLKEAYWLLSTAALATAALLAFAKALDQLITFLAGFFN